MTFGEKLQKLRTRAGLSQDQLAELLDVSRQAVSKWERNEAMPEAEKLVRISRQFGVSTDYLLLEELEEPETANTTAPAAGLWVRVKQWYRNRGYLLAWVLAAWGVWNLVDLAVLAANTYQQAQDLENFAWVKYVQMVYIPTMIPHVLLILVSVILVFRGRQLAGRLRWYHLGWLLVLAEHAAPPSRASAVFADGAGLEYFHCVAGVSGGVWAGEYVGISGGDFLGRPALSSGDHFGLRHPHPGLPV